MEVDSSYRVVGLPIGGGILSKFCHFGVRFTVKIGKPAPICRIVLDKDDILFLDIFGVAGC